MSKANIIRDLDTIRQFRQNATGSVGFVPSLGNFHAGHQSLFRQSVAENTMTIVCIVMTPIVFNDYNDFLNYPRTPEQDREKVAETGADVLFIPDHDTLFPGPFTYLIKESEFSNTMEGYKRPGHFDGVLTVLMKLLMLLKPEHLYLGEKDFQQLELVRHMCHEFYLPTSVVPCPIIRDQNGLAYSSRNSRLSADEQLKAAEFSALLKSMETPETIKSQLHALGFNVHYIEDHHQRRYGAVNLGNVRLIDNVEIPA